VAPDSLFIRNEFILSEIEFVKKLLIFLIIFMEDLREELPPDCFQFMFSVIMKKISDISGSL